MGTEKKTSGVCLSYGERKKPISELGNFTKRQKTEGKPRGFSAAARKSMKGFFFFRFLSPFAVFNTESY